MKRFLAIFFTACGLSLSAAAQQRSTLRGNIFDATDNAPLVGAVVLVDSTWHAIVDSRGTFSIEGIPRGERTVEVSFIGYETIRTTRNFDRATVNAGTIRMKATALLMEGVTITAHSNPVIQKGDTTQFNAASFRVNPDAEAADLIAKIPGMEVTESGITAQGETVARAYVNGELFFGDDAMAALSNLPADLIESVEMFDELPDDARFSGFNDGVTQRALNIVTKNKLDRTIDLRLSGAWGRELQRDIDGKYQSRYNVGGRFNRITSSTAINLNGLVNNTGQNRFGGGGRGRGGFGGGGGSGLRTIDRFGANYTTRLTEQSTLNVSYDYSGNRNRNNTLTINDYYATEAFDSRTTRDTLSSRSHGAEHQFFSRYEYEGERDRLRVQVRVEGDSDDSQRFSVNEEWRDGSAYTHSIDNDRSDGGGYNLDGEVDWSHRLGTKAGRTIAVEAEFEYGEDSSDGVEDSDLTKFYEGETDPTKIYWASTDDSFERRFQASVNYNEPIGERFRLNFRYRPSYNYSSNELLRFDQFGDLDEPVSERFTYDYLAHNVRAGLSYNKEDHFNFSVSLSGQSTARAQSMSLPRDYALDRSFTNLRPTFSFRYFIQKTKYFRVNYSTDSQLPSLEQLSSVVDISNPTRYTSGNANLKQSYNHSLNIRYNTNNIERSTNFYVGIRGSVTASSIQNQTLYFTEDTVLPEYGDFVFASGTNLRRYANAGSAQSLGGNAGYGFVLRPLRLNVNVGAGYTYSHTPSYDGTTLNKVNNNNASLFLGFNSNISENIDFNLGGMMGYGSTDNPRSNNRETWNQNAFARINWIFGGGFVVATNYMFSTNSTLDEPSNVWGASFGRKFLNNAAELRIEFSDILNQSRNYSYVYGTQAETQTWSRVMGRYAMARFTYRFNSLRGNRVVGPDGRRSEGGGETRGPGSNGPGGARPAGGPPGGGRPMGPPPGGF